MQYNNVILRVIDPANIQTVSELLQQQAEVSLTEPGCERFEVYHSQSDPQTFCSLNGGQPLRIWKHTAATKIS